MLQRTASRRFGRRTSVDTLTKIELRTDFRVMRMEKRISAVLGFGIICETPFLVGSRIFRIHILEKRGRGLEPRGALMRSDFNWRYLFILWTNHSNPTCKRTITRRFRHLSHYTTVSTYLFFVRNIAQDDHMLASGSAQCRRVDGSW